MSDSMCSSHGGEGYPLSKFGCRESRGNSDVRNEFTRLGFVLDEVCDCLDESGKVVFSDCFIIYSFGHPTDFCRINRRSTTDGDQDVYSFLLGDILSVLYILYGCALHTTPPSTGYHR